MIVQNGYIYGNNLFKENDIISVEVNTDKKTVHVFINNHLQPVSLCNVPVPMKARVFFFVGCLLIFIDLS
jgi:hypothetical protein